MKLSYVSALLSATVIASARPAVEAPQDCVSSDADVAESNAVHLRTDESDARIPTYQFGVSCNRSGYRKSVLTRNTEVSFALLLFRIASCV